MAALGRKAVSHELMDLECALLGVKRKLGFESAKGSFWRAADVPGFQSGHRLSQLKIDFERRRVFL